MLVADGKLVYKPQGTNFCPYARATTFPMQQKKRGSAKFHIVTGKWAKLLYERLVFDVGSLCGLVYVAMHHTERENFAHHFGDGTRESPPTHPSLPCPSYEIGDRRGVGARLSSGNHPASDK